MMTDAEEVRAILHALEPANRIAHSGRTLLSHLVGTWSILSAWGAVRHVRLAGLLHSVYSTEFMPVALQSAAEPDRIKRLAGAEAELLVHTFCRIDRDHFRTQLSRLKSPTAALPALDRLTGHVAPIERRMAQDIAVIEAANLVEHQNRIGKPPSAWMTSALFFMDWAGAVPKALGLPSLTLEAEVEAARLYRLALAADHRTARALLEECGRLNPYVGEVFLLSGAALLASGEWEMAVTCARDGMELLNAWTVPWEARLDIGAWSRLAHHITLAATQQNGAGMGDRLFEQCAMRIQSIPAPKEVGVEV